MYLGCIGDDFTGSTDLANTLTKSGLRTVQYNTIPRGKADNDADAAVIALKTRTLDVQAAVDQTLRALDWLKQQGCTQFYFKYCSTFDSTPQGNIGPVLDAMMMALDARQTVLCPAFPATGRTVFQGHLFVHDRLLSESGMQNHPLTPMSDPDIRRWLRHQTRHHVDHIDINAVREGASFVRSRIEEPGSGEPRHIIVDAIEDNDLMTLGKAVEHQILISGGSGLGMGLAQNFEIAREGNSAVDLDWGNKRVVVLAGSCSLRTREQIAYHRKSHPALYLDPEKVFDGAITPEDLADWALAQSADENRIPLIYSSAEPDAVRMLQQKFGSERLAAKIEGLFAETAKALVDRGLERLIAAGGETSGAVVTKLGSAAFEIGPEIAPGVPAVKVMGENLVLALKSGNFGDVDFFSQAAAVLQGGSQ